MEREAFLRRVRSSLAVAELPDVSDHDDRDPGLLVPVLPEVDLVERFRSALAGVGGVLHDADPLTTVREVAARHGAASFLAWDEEHLPPGVIPALEAAGLARVDTLVPPAGRREHQAGYLDVVLGVTAAEAGLAESGSIVVRSGAGRSRMASVIPRVHLAYLHRSEIHRSLAHWADRYGDTLATATNVVFITGVSRTGDIEMRLNTGVHGPEHVHVVLM